MKSGHFEAALLEDLEHGAAELGRGPRHIDAGGLEGLEFGRRRPLAARDDGPRVAHAPAGRGRHARDEGHDGLVWVAVGLEPLGGLLLGAAADLANHDDALCLGVVGKPLEAVDEVGAVERVAPDAHAGRLAQADSRRLGHRFIRESAGTGDDADLALLVDVTGHNSDLALARLDDARAVRADEPRGALLVEIPLDFDHVLLGDTLGDGHHQGDLGLDRVDDGGRAERGGHVDHGRVRLHGDDGLVHRIEDWEIEVSLSPLLGCYTSHHLRAVRNRLLAVEGALLPRESLADHFCVLVNPHVSSRTHASRCKRCKILRHFQRASGQRSHL
mmetsp:Transcript_18078/g.41329  ORF Transcript_18078/g.41329 Transcript_18078/m.41329 type:complete len:330 (+) Transcript_18078:381-1370(+)